MLTVSARQLQREYKKVLKKANRAKEPIIVIVLPIRLTYILVYWKFVCMSS